ncbi:C-Jun-amino-terminal kinase-interacting protein 4 [Merluccius polli]|uniref:C-Jun-amino-terminal kinase-interacting protein 4 n=1 Tax=Merluccius polli TaxID=89951 RepID=A0AA47NQU4_MERPO|nr:C-Jun-amino-terminal kinase-interacting protein 4 [Merluccius polli]
MGIATNSYRRYIALEDSQDGEKKDFQCRLVVLESNTRQMELKARNYADQISRLEEREAELKKEYNSLHQRHTEVCSPTQPESNQSDSGQMIHSYMEHLERSKHQHIAAVAPTEPSDTGNASRTR